MKSINELVEKLTPEERVLHKDLIEECKEREFSLKELDVTLHANIEKLNQISVKILMDIEKFYKLTVDIEKTFDNIQRNLTRNSIELIPDEKFYHA